MFMQKFIKIFNSVQMSFDYLMGYIMSIPMCMQNFIIIFHSVQEIGPFSLFQNLELGKASTDEKYHVTISWVDLVNINVYAKVYQNIPLSSRDRAIFPFSEFEPRQHLGQSKWHLTISWATSCQYHCVGKILSKYSKQFKELSTFFTNRPASKSSQTGRRQNLHKLSGLIIGHS